jgi:hypothetical protein
MRCVGVVNRSSPLGWRHRSLQRELLAILELAVVDNRWLTAQDALAQVQALGLSTPPESAAFVREDRDAR